MNVTDDSYFVEAECEEHGPFQQRCHELLEGLPPVKSPCPACSEAKRAAKSAEQEATAKAAGLVRRTALERDSGIPARFLTASFDGYKATGEVQRKVLKACRQYAAKFPDYRATGRSLVMTGGPGTGKTHLSCAIAREVMGTHLCSVRYITVAAMMRAVKDTYRKDAPQTETQVLASFQTPDLLILDEVGVQTGSEHEDKLMFEVLDARYREMLPTVLLSNLNTAELEGVMGHRIMDRYRECGSVLPFDWESYRGRKS